MITKFASIVIACHFPINLIYLFGSIKFEKEKNYCDKTHGRQKFERTDTHTISALGIINIAFLLVKDYSSSTLSFNSVSTGKQREHFKDFPIFSQYGFHLSDNWIFFSISF
jgi:hypothetical protein